MYIYVQFYKQYKVISLAILTGELFLEYRNNFIKKYLLHK